MKIQIVVHIFSWLVVCTGDEVTNDLEVSTEIDNLDFTTTIIPSEDDEERVTDFSILEGTQTEAATTQEPELLYLEFEYEFMDRETFWRNNTFDCINGTLEPSPYLRRKYKECEKIHRPYNPQCTTNCQMAITMLLDSRIPNLELFKRFFEIALPESLKEVAFEHYGNCFEKYGNTDDLLDYSCERPQPFFACINEFQSRMICSVE